YDNASGSLKPFGKIEKGERFPIATDYGNWWRVLFTDRVGYINKDLVKAEFQSGDNYFRVHKDNLAVYDNQSGYLKKIGELTKGQVYPISNNYGNWWHVDFGGSNGYVHKNDTGFATGKEIKNLNMNYSNSGKKFLVSQNTPVYDNTSGNLVPFGELERGTVFPITTDYGNWWRIIYLDRIGYVKKSDLLDFEAQDLEKLVVEYQHKDTSATVDRIKSFFINPNRNYVTSSNNILNGFYQISSYGTFDFSKGIHWGESPVKGEELSRSYYRALHANFFLNDLIAAYKENGNEEYIIKGFESIKDWVEKNPYQDPAHSMSWHDEASARRLVTWVNFFDSAKTVLNEEQLQFLLENMIEHADILLSNDFHTTNTNHGMFQDEALLVFSDYFNSLPKSQIYSEVGEERLESYFNFIISEEGVHLEHSPGYHQTIASSVKRYRDFFSLMGDSNQYNYYNSLYHLMANYYIWLIKPDGTLPLIGDTFSNVTPPTSLWKENQHYLYVLSQGKQGVKPGEHSVVFEDAGYAIFRDDWEKGDHATYIHFTAAYHTDYHKHSDDLSVWIYANGHDIISEAGPNGYDYDLPLTQFGYSSYAHNTLIVNDKGLPRTDGKYDKTHLVDYSLDDDISSVSGVNKRYEGVEHKRNLTYDRTLNEIRVKDSITSDDENNYKIIWNLAEGVTPRIEGNIIKLFIGEEEIGTLQINSNSEVTIEDIKGQKEPDLLGWHLNGTSNPIETHAIIIEAIDTNSEIESVFSLSQ
ncbi:alginate lyase family protein, partial [Sediminibacillus albus]